MTAPDDDLPCRELVELATEHLEGALDEDTERRVVEHLAGCDGCQDFVDQLRATAELAAGLRQDVPVQAVETAALDAFRARP